MILSLVLIEGKNVDQGDLRISLGSAKQLVVGKAEGFGVILHIAAQSPADLGIALQKLAQVKNVTGVLTLALRPPQ
jgi:hypothetical protein